MDPRETLIAETFALYREIGYGTFRAQFFTDREVMQQWPDAALREQHLRAEWNTLSQQHFESYRGQQSLTSTERLAAQRDLLKGVLAMPAHEQKSLMDRVHAVAGPAKPGPQHDHQRPHGLGR